MVLTKDRTDEIVKKIEEAIKRKRGNPNFNCPVCTNNEFSLGGGFTNDFLMDKLGRGLVIEGPVLPSVPIVCTNCGNTIFLNAKVLGININEEIKSKNGKEGGLFSKKPGYKTS